MYHVQEFFKQKSWAGIAASLLHTVQQKHWQVQLFRLFGGGKLGNGLIMANGY